MSQGPKGPLLTERDQKALLPWTTLYPVVQHRPHIAITAKDSDAADRVVADRRYPQSASLLAENYVEFSDMRILSKDPFYALNNLFRFTAQSEALALSTLEVIIDADARVESANHEWSTLSNLLFFQSLLKEHEMRLRENIEVIKRRGHQSWPHISSSEGSLYAKAEAAAEALLKDFEYLLERAKSLAERCTQGTNIIMNNAMLTESKRAIKQAEEVGKLTRIAFFYIPLSFTTSFFGMNFKQLATDNLSIWIWFIVSGPVLGLSVCFFLWDYRAFLLPILELGGRLKRMLY